MNYTVQFDLLVNLIVTAEDEESARTMAQKAVEELMEYYFSNGNVDMNDYQCSEGVVFGEGD